MKITEHQIKFFDTFGFLSFKGLLTDCIDEITAAFEEVWQQHGYVTGPNQHKGDRRSCISPFIDKHERLSALLDDRRILGIAEELLGNDFNYCTSDGNLYSGDTNYHSKPFYGGVKALKIALYLDPVTVTKGCLRVIPGSHKFGDVFADYLHEGLDRSDDLWHTAQSQIPYYALESNPGDVIVFNHCVKHGSFGGGNRRRLFVINCSERFPDDKIKDLKTMIGAISRFWADSFYSKIMVETADKERMKHLEQVLANQDHLPALVAQVKREMSEPSNK